MPVQQNNVFFDTAVGRQQGLVTYKKDPLVCSNKKPNMDERKCTDTFYHCGLDGCIKKVDEHHPSASRWVLFFRWCLSESSTYTCAVKWTRPVIVLSFFLQYMPLSKVHDTRTRNSCGLTRAKNLYVCHTDLQQDISRASFSHQIERVLFRASFSYEFLVWVSRTSFSCVCHGLKSNNSVHHHIIQWGFPAQRCMLVSELRTKIRPDIWRYSQRHGLR